MSDFNPSQAFADFFFFALDHGFASIEDSGGPLVPFTMTMDREGQKQLTRYVKSTLEDSVQAAKDSITSEGANTTTMYAIAWDGFITVEGQKWDAILVEAGEVASEFGVLMAQRYTVAKTGLLRRTKKAQRVGNAALVEHPASRLWRPR